MAAGMSAEEKMRRQALLQHKALCLYLSSHQLHTRPDPREPAGFLPHYPLAQAGQKSPKTKKEKKKNQLGDEVGGFYTLEKPSLFNPEVGLNV